MHKCFGSVEDLKTSISSSVMTTMQLLVWDRSIASSMVTIVTPVLALGVLLDLALHGLFLCILNHRNVAEDGKYYVYIHNVGYKFLITYFVFTSFCLTMMFLEMASWKVDRGISCPENRYLCASLK
uniref:Uncharacterized protein n=1 Tax=Caenorhabditis japonica TaxID=281687 RepID=A0A8R1IGN4_CAEJA